MTHLFYRTCYDPIKPSDAFHAKTLQMLNDLSNEYQQKRKKTRVYKTISLAACFTLIASFSIIFGLNYGRLFPSGGDGNATSPPASESVRYNSFMSKGDKGVASFTFKGRIYTPVSQDNTVKSINGVMEDQAIRQEDFGTFLGQVEICENDFLLGASIYQYQPIESEAIVIVQKDDKCELFAFRVFDIKKAFSMQEAFKIYNIKSANDIVQIRVIEVRHEQSADGHFTTIKDVPIKELTDQKSIQNLFDAVKDLVKAENNSAKEEKILGIEIVFKDGLETQFIYAPESKRILAFNWYMNLNEEQNDVFQMLINH